MAIPPGFEPRPTKSDIWNRSGRVRGLRLDREAIKPNAAKRGLAKLCLYSMCGKLTERNDRTRTKFITEPHEL